MTQSKATIDAREAVHKAIGEIFTTLV
jgi:hypothetical protein